MRNKLLITLLGIFAVFSVVNVVAKAYEYTNVEGDKTTLVDINWKAKGSDIVGKLQAIEITDLEDIPVRRPTKDATKRNRHETTLKELKEQFKQLKSDINNSNMNAANQNQAHLISQIYAGVKKRLEKYSLDDPEYNEL